MNNLRWKDETSYSRGQRGNIPPRILSVEVEGIRITIHRHRDYPDTWLLTCRYLNIENKDLDTNDFDVATSNAKDHILNKIYKINQLRDALVY